MLSEVGIDRCTSTAADVHSGSLYAMLSIGSAAALKTDWCPNTFLSPPKLVNFCVVHNLPILQNFMKVLPYSGSKYYSRQTLAEETIVVLVHVIIFIYV